MHSEVGSCHACPPSCAHASKCIRSLLLEKKQPISPMPPLNFLFLLVLSFPLLWAAELRSPRGSSLKERGKKAAQRGKKLRRQRGRKRVANECAPATHAGLGCILLKIVERLLAFLPPGAHHRSHPPQLRSSLLYHLRIHAQNGELAPLRASATTRGGR